MASVTVDVEIVLLLLVSHDWFCSDGVVIEMLSLRGCCRDGLIAQLQEQIDDLTVSLEEERLNHRETRRLVCVVVVYETK